MKKHISLLLVAIFAFSVALGLVGCKKEEATTEPAKTEEAAPAAEEAAK